MQAAPEEEYRDAAHYWQKKWATLNEQVRSTAMVVTIRGGVLESVDGVAPGTEVIVYEETVDGSPLSFRIFTTGGR